MVWETGSCRIMQRNRCTDLPNLTLGHADPVCEAADPPSCQGVLSNCSLSLSVHVSVKFRHNSKLKFLFRALCVFAYLVTILSFTCISSSFLGGGGLLKHRWPQSVGLLSQNAAHWNSSCQTANATPDSIILLGKALAQKQVITSYTIPPVYGFKFCFRMQEIQLQERWEV